MASACLTFVDLMSLRFLTLNAMPTALLPSKACDRVIDNALLSSKEKNERRNRESRFKKLMAARKEIKILSIEERWTLRQVRKMKRMKGMKGSLPDVHKSKRKHLPNAYYCCQSKIFFW